MLTTTGEPEAAWAGAADASSATTAPASQRNRTVLLLRAAPTGCTLPSSHRAREGEWHAGMTGTWPAPERIKQAWPGQASPRAAPVYLDAGAGPSDAPRGRPPVGEGGTGAGATAAGG